MKDLNFTPFKNTSEFLNNYKLHDKACNICKNLFTGWGVEFQEFGEDRRNERVWENGMDKPDLIIKYKDKSVLVDIKGKNKEVWIINRRAAESYIKWGRLKNLPVIICFVIFEGDSKINSVKFSQFKYDAFEINSSRQWDKNETVEFKDPPEVLTKANLMRFIFEK